MRTRLVILLALLLAGCATNPAIPRIDNPRLGSWQMTWDTYKRALKAGDVYTVERCLTGEMLRVFMDRRLKAGDERMSRRIMEDWQDVEFSDEHLSLVRPTFVNISVVMKPLVGGMQKVMFMMQDVRGEWKLAVRNDLGAVRPKKKQEKKR